MKIDEFVLRVKLKNELIFPSLAPWNPFYETPCFHDHFHEQRPLISFQTRRYFFPRVG